MTNIFYLMFGNYLLDLHGVIGDDHVHLEVVLRSGQPLEQRQPRRAKLKDLQYSLKTKTDEIA